MLPDQVDNYYFPPSRKRWGITFVGGAFFFLFNCWIAISQNEPGLYFVAAFFGLFGLVGLINLVPGGGGLYIDRQGFAYRFFFKERRFAWNAIGAFHATSSGLLAHIGFRKLADIEKAAGKPTPGELLPESYGMPAGHLADLLNAWRDYALTGQHRLTPGTPAPDPVGQPI